MRNSQHQLVFNGRNPGIVVQLQDGSGAEEVETAQGGREDGQSVALQMKLSQSGQFSDLLGNIHQLVVPQSQDSQILHVLYVRTQMFKLIVTQVECPGRRNTLI